MKLNQIVVWDGINAEFWDENPDMTKEDAIREIIEHTVDPTDGIHPDVEMVYIMQVIGVVKIDEETNILDVAGKEIPFTVMEDCQVLWEQAMGHGV